MLHLGKYMTKDTLPANGQKVILSSTLPNVHRRSLNGAICTILSRIELPPNSPVYKDYTDHIAIEVRLPWWSIENPKHNGGTTWVDLTEIRELQKLQVLF